MISEEDNEDDSHEDSDEDATLKNRDLTDEEYPCDDSMKKLEDLDPELIAVKPAVSQGAFSISSRVRRMNIEDDEE